MKRPAMQLLQLWDEWIVCEFCLKVKEIEGMKPEASNLVEPHKSTFKYICLSKKFQDLRFSCNIKSNFTRKIKNIKLCLT